MTPLSVSCSSLDEGGWGKDSTAAQGASQDRFMKAPGFYSSRRFRANNFRKATCQTCGLYGYLGKSVSLMPTTDLRFLRRLFRELGQIIDVELPLGFADPPQHVLEAVLADLLVLDVLELVTHQVVFLLRHDMVQRRK